MYVQIDESYEEILNILQSTDFITAGEIIAKERRSRNTITHKMHSVKKWATVVKSMSTALAELTVPLIIIN